MNIHLFIIWHNAMPKQASILNTLGMNFCIIKVYEMDLSAYGTIGIMEKLYDFPCSEAQKKMSACGYGKINIILVQDDTIEQEVILTKYGYIPIHKKAYDVKCQIRKQLDNASLFHGTMADFELEHDYRTCFQKSPEMEQLLAALPWDGSIEVICYG